MYVELTLFADDTSVFLYYREINTPKQKLNSELPKLTLWFRSNVLSLSMCLKQITLILEVENVMTTLLLILN